MTTDPTTTGTSSYYLVRYAVDGAPRPEARVTITPGYTTFESIRTILAVKNLGSQTPDRIDVFSVQKVPSPAERAQLAALLNTSAHSED